MGKKDKENMSIRTNVYKVIRKKRETIKVE